MDHVHNLRLRQAAAHTVLQEGPEATYLDLTRLLADRAGAAAAVHHAVIARLLDYIVLGPDVPSQLAGQHYTSPTAPA